MRLLLPLASRDLLGFARSTRSWVLLVAYVALATAPAILLASRAGQLTRELGPGTLAAETFALLPALTALFAFLWTVELVGADRASGAWHTLIPPTASNTGYLLRRALTIALTIGPICALPIALVFGVSWWHEGMLPPAAPFAVPYLFQVLPIAVSFAALGLGAGALGRGLLGGLLVAIAALWVSGTVVGWALGTRSSPLSVTLSWLNWTEARWAFIRAPSLFSAASDLYPLPASDSPWELAPAIAQYLHLAGPVFWVGPLLAAAAGLYLGRTEGDVRPWKALTSGQTRTLGGLLEKARRLFRPDAYLGPVDGLLVGLIAVLHASALGALLSRSGSFLETAAEAATCRRQIVETTPRRALIARLELNGSLSADGEIVAEALAKAVNGTDSELSRLVFVLNPKVSLLEARTADGELQAERCHERLVLALPRPLPAGQQIGLRFKVAGRPARHALQLPRWIGSDWGNSGRTDLLAAWDPVAQRPATDLSGSYAVPALSSRRTFLRFSDLAPLPRYTDWSQGAAPELLGPGGEALLQEGFRPPTDLEVALGVPPGLLLADACGNWNRDAGPRDRLAGRCELPLADYVVAGGPLETVNVPGLRIAGLRRHSRTLAVHASGLAHAVDAIQAAWPGLHDEGPITFLEWPEPTVHNKSSYALRGWGGLDQRPYLFGRLALLPEEMLISRKRLNLELELAESFALALSGRRPAAEADAHFFERLVAELFKRSQGIRPPSGATVPPFPGGPVGVELPLAKATGEMTSYWNLRFPAIVAALEAYLGPAPLRRVTDAYLSDLSSGPARIESFLEMLLAEDPVDRPVLAELVEGSLRQGGIAVVALVDGAVRPKPGGWIATGAAVNTGTAATTCDIEVITEAGSSSVGLSVPANGDASFSLELESRPQKLVLDPLMSCHRYRGAGSRDELALD